MEETTLYRRLPENRIDIHLTESRLKNEKNQNRLNNISYFLILLFTYSSLRKFADLDMFVREIWGFAIYGSKGLIKFLLICLGSAELIIAILLSTSRTRHLGLYGSFILTIIINVCFFILQQYAKVIPMYYGGILPGVSFLTHFFFNLICLFVALYGVLLQISVDNNAKL